MTGEAANPTFYNTDAAAYDAQRWTGPGGRLTNRAQLAILQELCAAWAGRVLEVGPGTGRFTVPLARRGCRMTLLDISSAMLAEAQANAQAAGVGERLEQCVQGSIYELPFDDGEFDHALSLNVFNHLERPEQALRELCRVIRPGATLLFNYANLQSWYYPAARRINARATAVGQDVYSAWRRPADVRRMIEQAGLEPLRRRGHVHVPRAMEKYRLHHLVRVLDGASRRGPLAALAPVHFWVCRRKEGTKAPRHRGTKGG